MLAPWSITYHDGSANGFTFASDGEGATYAYDPVKPAQSSSGSYSGGDARKGRIAAEQAASLVVRVRELELDMSTHARSRMMGTGAISVIDAVGTRKFFVAAGPRLQAFHHFVVDLTGGRA